MADGVNVNIGTESSTIEESTISVGNVDSRHTHLAETVSRLEARLLRVEDLLGGHLGIPGLTQEMSAMQKDLAEIKDEIKRTYINPLQYIMVIFSAGALVLAVLVTAFGMLR